MEMLLSYILLIGTFIGLVFGLKGFSYKHISLLVLGGAILLIFLQFVYISFGREFSINLFFLKGNIEVSNFIQAVENYFNKSGFLLGGMGLFSLFFSLVIPATLEEFGKFYFFRKITSRLGILKSVASCVFAIVYVAIGFAFFETGAYIYFLGNRPGSDDLLTIATIRIVISTLSHIFFSALVGYYFGKALFMKFELIDNLEISKTTKLLKKLKKIPFIHIQSISNYYRAKYLITGFSLSIFLHTIYNFFMSTGNEIFAIFTVLIGITFFIKLITTKKYSKNYLELKNKIAYLQEMKSLKEKMKRI